MKARVNLLAFIIIFTALFSINTCADNRNSYKGAKYDMVIYGGSFSAYAAVKTALKDNPKLKILMIVPQTVLGEIGTAAGQNYWDTRIWKEKYAKGPYQELYNKYGRGYDPVEMSKYILNDLKKYKNVYIFSNHDISNATIQNNEIKGIEIKKLLQKNQGYVFQEMRPIKVNGKVYIDASYNGRLLRLSNFTGVVGRNDYTPETLQQAVTLVFKVKNIDVDKAVKSKRFKTFKDENGSRLMWGGYSSEKDKKVVEFNKKYWNRFKIKGFNMAADDKGIYWINGILMYNVDAAKEAKDKGTTRYPKNNYYSIDDAHKKFKTLIMSNEFKNVLKTIPGFAKAKIVGTADMLYVRESIHSSLSKEKDMNNFAMTHEDTAGIDWDNYLTSIGTAFYVIDSNGYTSSIREDKYYHVIQDNSKSPKYPVQIPYSTLLNPNIKNILVCGYGANISSMAWFVMRVLPNQMTLGNAAGIAGSLAVKKNKNPLHFNLWDIKEIQERLPK